MKQFLWLPVLLVWTTLSLAQVAVDVKSGANGCPAAVGNNAVDDTAAIQCQLNFMYPTNGTVLVSSGYFRVSGGGLVVKGGVQLIGEAGQSGSGINVATDSPVVTFDASTCVRGASMQNLTIVGYQNPSATANAVTVGANCPTILRDNTIWNGASGLYTSGVDGLYENNFICGYAASVTSKGANWYVRDKLDTCGLSSTYAFHQIAPTIAGQSAENHFTQTDFSGKFTYSLLVDDGSNTSSILTCSGCVLGAPIVINRAKSTIISASEIGSTIFTNNSAGPIIAMGNYFFSSTYASGKGHRVCYGNFNLVC